MKAARTGPRKFLLEFESEEELREEHQSNLSQGGLRLPVAEKPALFSTIDVTLRGPFGSVLPVTGRVVAPLPDGVALSIEGDSGAILRALLATPGAEAGMDEKDRSLWDRLRALPRTEKLLLAPKADRTERLVLVQDNDPQVLYALLKNPRITVDEVVRIAKSAYLTYQTAELILKTTPWTASLEVRVALVHNPKTPPAFALRIVPTLPEAEVKAIARGAATSMALKQAALKRLQGGG
ncbi:MAG: PilZ domain-containing protein [Thermoanaerobaculia bacterium]